MKVIEHVLKSVLGQPAIQEDGNKEISKRGIEDGRNERCCGDDFKHESPSDQLLENVALKSIIRNLIYAVHDRRAQLTL